MTTRRAAAPIFLLSLLVAGCDLAQGIFKGGFFLGLLVAIVVIVIVVKLFFSGGEKS